ncbi:MAG: DUF2726 domain-containing protein [Victivallaceae bacterium]|nr:DUF2726 domain-containing protein [Victivallaceae bacterium]
MSKEITFLITIAVIVGIIKGLDLFVFNNSNYRNIKEKIKRKFISNNNSKITNYPFETTNYIMSNAELNFYHSIKKVLTNEHAIFTKVRMEDIIQVKKQNKNKFALRNKIKSRHIDFVICDTKTGKIQRAIELNDSSHNQQDRIERDLFVQKAFKSAGIKLLIMKNKKNYTRKDIEMLFQ